MASNVTSEQTIRDQLTTLLGTYLTAAGVQATFGYDIANMQGQSPVVINKQGSIDRTQRFIGGTQPHVWFYFQLETWVIVGDKASPAWTSQQVENEMGLIEKKVIDCLDDNPRSAGKWDFIQTAGPATAPVAKVVGSNKYRMRVIPIKARVIGG
ncbi:MAG: hypothetical protein WCF84_02310 [Anaerolineae bacterium]